MKCQCTYCMCVQMPCALTYVGEELLTCSAVENSVRPLCLACMKTVVQVIQAKSWLCCWMYLLTTKGHPNYFKSRALLIKYL